MNLNPTSKKSWVSEINKSEADIKRNEKINIIVKYSTIIMGCVILLFVVIILGKSKLKVINPKFTYVEDSFKNNTIVQQTEIQQKPISTTILDENIKREDLTTTLITNSSKDYLEKNRPQNTLNGNINQLNQKISTQLFVELA